MGSFIARILLCLILGWIMYETISKFSKLFALSLNPYLGIAPGALLFILQEYAIRKWMIRDESVSANKSIGPKGHRIFSVLTWSLVICLLLSIMIVWLGVIYKQIVGGG